METGGLFVTLYDKETLRLYLDRGVYGQHMTPQEGTPSSQSAHYKTLADYSAARAGKHVFFFLEREIYYGGQIVGSDEHGSFFLNGQMSPMGRKADAPLVWDESGRDKYGSTSRPGVFDAGGERGEKCQPFLIRFEDEIGLAGSYIISDQLYFELGEYPYPLPSNSIAGMGFCTLTPGETKILLRLLQNEPDGEIEPVTEETTHLYDEPVPFSPEFGVNSPEEAHPEAHLEASVIANPNLLPSHLHPEGATICRQVPISPFKPADMDQADVCYFSDDLIRDGTIPNTIIELKIRKAGKGAALQVKRYLRWLHDRLGDEANEIDVHIYAPGFTRTFDGYISDRYRGQIEKIDFEEGYQETFGGTQER